MKAAVADPGRPAADTARDGNRKPAEMLAFAGITPGKVVVDMLPGGGYFTRIFAKAVEPGGRVYAYFGSQYDARLKTQGKDPDNQFADLKATYHESGRDPRPAGPVRHARAGGHGVDRPTITTTCTTRPMTMDVNAVNKAIFKSLKPGGYYVIVDHRRRNGRRRSHRKLHRIKESTVKKEVEAAGFKLVAEGKILTHPSDDGTKRVFEAESGQDRPVHAQIPEAPSLKHRIAVPDSCAAAPAAQCFAGLRRSRCAVKARLTAFDGQTMSWSRCRRPATSGAQAAAARPPSQSP